MLYNLRILLAGRSRAELDEIEQLLRGHPGMGLETRLITNGHADPLHDVETLPDALIFVVSGNWRAELESLMARPPSARPPVLVAGPAGDMELIRTAMRAGARDVLRLPLTLEDITPALGQLSREHLAESGAQLTYVTAVINAKGGSGATVVATNLAHVLATQQERRTLLVDLDYRFGGLPTYFNLTPRHGLVEALEMVSTLDGFALRGLVQRGAESLDLLASTGDPVLQGAETLVPLSGRPMRGGRNDDQGQEERSRRAEELERWVEEEWKSQVSGLLQVFAQEYQELVFDVPRVVDASTAPILEHADRILVLTQQTVAHLSDTKRLLAILQQELGIPGDRLVVLVNRFDKKGSVGLSDIEEALDGVRVWTLPNDYQVVVESINLGTPLVEMARSCALARRLVKLASALRHPESLAAKERSGWPLFTWNRD
jgi:pilus assembly protein CpaE